MTTLPLEPLDVRTIPPVVRHATIFGILERLPPGEAFSIVNDHDPFPLENQFNFMKRGQFRWEYVQRGPDVWRVRITRIEPQ